MKIRILLFILVASTSALAFGAVHVKGNLHFEPFYDSGLQQPADDAAYEWWFEKNRVAFLVPRWCFTLDREKGLLIAVNLNEKFFVESALPLKVETLVDEELGQSLNQYKIEGQVKKTGNTSVFLKKKCQEYLVSESMVFQEGRFYDRERTLLATTDVPFDWKLIDELYAWIRGFFNPSGSYLNELKKIEGFIMACDDIRYQEGVQVKYGFRVLEIGDEQAPESVFSVPEGFKKKETLTRPELIDIRTTYYFYYR